MDSKYENLVICWGAEKDPSRISNKNLIQMVP